MALKPLKQAFGRAQKPAVRFPDKKADKFYTSPEWLRTRARILQRDGGRCTAVWDGFRCESTATIVDHIKRRRDGGDESDGNLRSLCRACDNRLKEKWDGSRRGV